MTHAHMAPRGPAHAADRTPSQAPGHAPRREPRESVRSIHMVVDLNKCQAYAQCCFLAPEVFRLHGEEALWYDPAPDAEQRDHVLRAAAACPVQAITVEVAEVAGPGTTRTRSQSSHKKAKEPHAASTQRP